MDQTPLVERDIEAGRRLAELLRKHKSVRAEAAFWWWDDGQWRFVVATPIVHQRGRLAAHRKIRDVLGAEAKDFQHILDRLDVRSPSEGVITILDIGPGVKVPIDRMVSEEAIDGVYVDGAYFYHFAPKTFAHA